MKGAAMKESVMKAIPRIRKSAPIPFLESLEPRSVDLLMTAGPTPLDVHVLSQRLELEEALAICLSRVKRTGRALFLVRPDPALLNTYLTVAERQDPLRWGNVLTWVNPTSLRGVPRLDFRKNYGHILHLRGDKAPSLNRSALSELNGVQVVQPSADEGLFFTDVPRELLRRLIFQTTRPGALVVDPYSDTGSILLEAASMRRESLGCEMSEVNLEIAIKRGCTKEE